MSSFETTAWPGGIDNRSNWRKLKAGFVRDAVNVDVNTDGSMHLRAGFERVFAGTGIRGAIAVGDQVLVAAGADLVLYDEPTDTTTVLATIDGGGRFSGTVFNQEAFFCTETQMYRYAAGALRQWGVRTVTSQPVPTLVAGGLQPGTYQLAMTWTDAAGDEGGTTGAIQIDVPAGSALQVDLPAAAGLTPNLYVSEVNGSTLYKQGSGAGTHAVRSIDSGARLETMWHQQPTPGSQIADHNGVIAIADGRTLWLTTPLRPHLVDRARGFFQYPADIGFVISASGGLYVSADKVYFISGVETGQPEQSTASEYPGVPGSACKLPDDGACWMTQYGVATSDTNGQVRLLSAENFVPELALAGSSGILESNGNQLVVTTMQGNRGANPLAASDYYEAEIVTP